MKVDLSTDLANLISVTGRLIVCIHAYAGKLEGKGATAKAALDTMSEYSSITAKFSPSQPSLCCMQPGKDQMRPRWWKAAIA